MYRIGPVQKKIIVTLVGGVVLGSTSSPRQYFKVLREIKREWKNINSRSFSRSMQRLSREKLIEKKMLPNGNFKLELTKKGKNEARKLSLLGSSVACKKPKKWDGKWRIVIFDIPEKDRIFRGILREHLYELKFAKLQQSVFVSPHPFERAILELTRLYSAERYVRVITALKIDNEQEIKKKFQGIIK
ncbi:MAG: hypothetical protein OEV93_00985 [Candidatus Moranbacteria bacterium]|nr:hypothetical protein [Candidatus Moranbacteria bacterium]